MKSEDYLKAKPKFEKKEKNTKAITDLEAEILFKQTDLDSLNVQLQAFIENNIVLDTEIDEI